MLLWLISIICAQCDGVFVMSIGSKGDGPGHFLYPVGLALTPDGLHLLVADSGNARVVVLAASDGAWVRALTGEASTLCQPLVWPWCRRRATSSSVIFSYTRWLCLRL